MVHYVKLLEAIILHEGRREFVYKDSLGIETIGYGRNLREKGLSEDEMKYLLANDIKDAMEDIKRVFPKHLLDIISLQRTNVLVEMMYNLGYTRFVKFKKMIMAVNNRDWERAADEMVDSLWYRQVKDRGKRLVAAMREDKFPTDIEI